MVTARSRGATRPTSLSLPSWTCAVPTLAPALNSGLACQALKPQLHQPHQFLDPLVEAVEPGDDHHQPPAVLLGRAGEAVAGLVGVAGLEAVGAGDPAEQRVAVGLGDVLRPSPASCPR